MNVHIRLLGGFEVTVDEAVVPADAWSRRHASALVKVLALARGRRLHRDQVIDLLWPDLPTDTAMPRLHKAAHYARRALGTDASASLVLRNDLVALLPGADVVVDAIQFRTEGEAALASGSVDRAAGALCWMPVRCCPRTSTSRGAWSRARHCGGCAWPCCG